jgi:hypothetical protein
MVGRGGKEVEDLALSLDNFTDLSVLGSGWLAGLAHVDYLLDF